jgi:hypothetical protein
MLDPAVLYFVIDPAADENEVIFLPPDHHLLVVCPVNQQIINMWPYVNSLKNLEWLSSRFSKQTRINNCH